MAALVRSEDSAAQRDVLIISDPIAPQWSLDDFDIGKRLGEGQFGAVYLAKERRTGLVVALKAIKKSQLLSTFNEHLLRREIEIHSHLIHPNILGFYGWFVTNTHIILILEIAPKGELMDTLIDGGLPEKIVSQYMLQMISAIRCCHRLNVMHRDLKPENILVDVLGNLKLADFGWAAHVPEEETSGQKSPSTVSRPPVNVGNNPNFRYLKTRRKTYCGTLDYLSPEICRHEWYGKEVDLWCLGVLCYELATGGPPFSHDNYIVKGYSEDEARKMQQRDIQNSDIQSRLTASMSPQLKDFLCRTLAKDPSQRMNTNQMIHHPFIMTHNDIRQEAENDRLFEDRGKSSCMPQSSQNLLAAALQTVATPCPGRSPGPKWQYSRHFLSAASSPNSGPLASGPNSPFHVIRANGDTPPLRMFAIKGSDENRFPSPSGIALFNFAKQ